MRLTTACLLPSEPISQAEGNVTVSGSKRTPSHPTSRRANRVIANGVITSPHSGILEKAVPIRAFKTSGRVIKGDEDLDNRTFHSNNRGVYWRIAGKRNGARRRCSPLTRLEALSAV